MTATARSLRVAKDGSKPKEDNLMNHRFAAGMTRVSLHRLGGLDCNYAIG
jgi:hypothetical protein